MTPEPTYEVKRLTNSEIPDCVGKIIIKKVQPLQTPRKSVRKTKSAVKAEKIEKIKRLVREETEAGLEIRILPGKGRCLFATKSFNRGEFVVEYAGELLEMSETRFRERFYGLVTSSSFMFYFAWKDKKLCVDTPKKLVAEEGS
jgi:[histone H4]-lysine20 N-methyltransferase SETD8